MVSPSEAQTTHWVHSFDPFIVQFSDKIGIRWYGFFYLLSFICIAILLKIYKQQGKINLDKNQQATLLISIIIGVLVGGRVGSMLFYNFNAFIQNPLILFKIWEPGMASHGGFIGVILAILWFAKHTKTNPLFIGDICTSMAPIGLFFGRIGNFINGELWGKASNVKHAIIFPESAPPGTPFFLIEPRHPSQLYEATLEGFILLIYVQLRFWKRKTRPWGQLSGEFLIGYTLLRAIGEYFREPDASLILGISRGTFYSIFLGALGIFLIAYARLQGTKNESHQG